MDGISMGGGSGLQSFAAYNHKPTSSNNSTSSDTTSSNLISNAISNVSQTKDYTQAGTVQSTTDNGLQSDVLSSMGIGSKLNVEV